MTIDLTLVHHGFVATPKDWAFSGWYAYFMNKNTNINAQEAMHWFGSKDNFRAIHQKLHEKKMQLLFEE